MKKVLFLFGLVAVMSACAGNQKSETVSNRDSVTVIESFDSIEVDSVVFVDSITVE